MNAAAVTAKSIDAVNQILQNASAESIKVAEKLMKVSVEMSVGAETGKGNAVDVKG